MNGQGNSQSGSLTRRSFVAGAALAAGGFALSEATSGLAFASDKTAASGSSTSGSASSFASTSASGSASASGSSTTSKSAAASASSAASASAASSASSASSADAISVTPILADGNWDEEHEFVVLGTGGAIFASIAAHNAGHDIVVLEKRATYGGTMFFSAGAMWCPGNSTMDDDSKAIETPELAIEYLTNLDEGGTHSTDLISDFVHKAPSVWDYLVNDLKLPFATAHHDYYAYEGTNHGRSSYLLDAEGNQVHEGVCWQDSVSPVVDASGLDIRLSTRATALVIDDSGAVVGVEAIDSDGKTMCIKGEKGVLIATGSFDYNEQMTSAYIMPPFAKIIPTECTGDGQRMAMALGADFCHMSQDFGHAFFKGIDSDDTHAMWFVGCLLYPGCILVGRDGHRFLNESCSYDELSRELCNLNVNLNGRPTYYSENAICIMDSRVVSDYGWPSGGDEKPDWLTEFQTLDDLAEGMGIEDVDALKAEVDKYNGYCDKGVDEDFHRGEGPYDSADIDGQGYGMCVVGGVGLRDDLANSMLAPLSEPPYYACIAMRGSLGTAGGLVVDKDAHVLKGGEPVPGLYAAGCAADALVNGYPGGGFPIFSSVARSFFAMEDALDLGIVKEAW